VDGEEVGAPEQSDEGGEQAVAGGHDVHAARAAGRGSVVAVAVLHTVGGIAAAQGAGRRGRHAADRAGRARLRPTDVGRALAGEAEGVLAALARADAAVLRLRTVPRGGQVRTVILPSGARMLLAGVLERLDHVPEVDLLCRDVDMPPVAVPAPAAEFDIVVTHRDEPRGPPSHRAQAGGVAAARAARGGPAARTPAGPAPDAAARRARGRSLDQRRGRPAVDDVLRSLALHTGTQQRGCSASTTSPSPRSWWRRAGASRCCPRYSTDDRGGQRLARRPLVGYARRGWWRRCCAPVSRSGLPCARCSTRCGRRRQPWSAGCSRFGSFATTSSAWVTPVPGFSTPPTSGRTAAR